MTLYLEICIILSDNYFFGAILENELNSSFCYYIKFLCLVICTGTWNIDLERNETLHLQIFPFSSIYGNIWSNLIQHRHTNTKHTHTHTHTHQNPIFACSQSYWISLICINTTIIHESASSSFALNIQMNASKFFIVNIDH